MIKAKATKGLSTLFGLVRDKNGKPKIDDYGKCPDRIKQMLTQQEREEFENGNNSRNSN